MWEKIWDTIEEFKKVILFLFVWCLVSSAVFSFRLGGWSSLGGIVFVGGLIFCVLFVVHILSGDLDYEEFNIKVVLLLFCIVATAIAMGLCISKV